MLQKSGRVAGKKKSENRTERKVPGVTTNQSLKREFLQQISRESNQMLQKAPGPGFRKILDTVPLKKEMLLIECMMTARGSLRYRKRPQRRRKMMTVGWNGTLMNQRLRKARSFHPRKVKKRKM